MCFPPQRRALFRHLNFQKWSDHGVFCTFWLGNVLRATTTRTFSTSQLPKVVRTWGALYLLTWKCASRHNGVQFFIAPVASWLRTRRFSEPTFRPSWATNHWKNTVFRDFPTFSRICIFCPLTLSLPLFSLLIFLFSLPLPYSAFHLSILSEVWLLSFLRQSLHKHVPVLLCTTKLAQTRSSTTVYYKACTNTFQYYCILQSLHKVAPNTTLYYKACTKHFPVLLRTTKLAQTRSSTTVYYKACTKHVPSTTVYYKACTKHVPVLPYTTKLAQTRSSTTVYYQACTNTFQYYRILQACTNTFQYYRIVYYKTRTDTFQYYRILQNSHKHVPVLPYTTKLALAQTRSSTTVYYTTRTNTVY